MCLLCLEAAGKQSSGEEWGTSMSELGVVITWVPTVLRPQIQEAASAPHLVARRLLQGESRLPAGRESTAPSQHSHDSSCVGTQLTGTRETLTLLSWVLATLWGSRLMHSSCSLGGRGGQRLAAGRCREPQNSQMRMPDTQADGERAVTVVPGRRTVGGQDKRSQRSRGRARGASSPGAELHEKVWGPG